MKYEEATLFGFEGANREKRGEQFSEGAWTEAKASDRAKALETSLSRRESDRAT